MQKKIQFRNLKENDIPYVVKIWNSQWLYDQLTVQSFQTIFSNDPNVKEDNVIVCQINSKIIGFICFLVRDTIEGLDGKGYPEDFENGYIKGWCIKKNIKHKDIVLRDLFEKAIGYIRDHKKIFTQIGDYSGIYITPGIDSRYKEIDHVLKKLGFDQVDNEHDVSINLQEWDHSILEDLKPRMNKMGIIYHKMGPQPLDIFRYNKYRIEKLDNTIFKQFEKFVEIIKKPDWFPPGWQNNFNFQQPTFLALHKDEIVGWVQYNPTKSNPTFGPIAVHPDYFRKSIGSFLLNLCMYEMKVLGIDNIFASWVDLPFYIANKWEIFRIYNVYRKKIN